MYTSSVNKITTRKSVSIPKYKYSYNYTYQVISMNV